MLLFRLRFPGFSLSFRPGFPCLVSGSVYLAFCQFPFILPCFTPTAVPQVLAWLRSPFRSLRFSISPFFSAFFRPLISGFDYSASVSSFPFFPFLPHGGFSGACLSAFSSVCFHTSVSALVLSFPAFPFSAPLFRITGATSAAGLLFPARPFPLAFALGSGYLAWVMHPQN